VERVTGNRTTTALTASLLGVTLVAGLVALVLAVLLVGLGFWVAASPTSIPGLTQLTPMHIQP
jgi:hypothetical protein